VPLTSGALNDRFDRMIRHLDHWGTVDAHDHGRTRPRRVLEFQLEVPGDGLAVDARALFREYYDRGRTGTWTLIKYTYEYADLVRAWRLSYHFHPIGGGPPVPHAHCEPGDGLRRTESAHHFRSLEYDLREANAAFMRLHAAGRAPDCYELLPLDIDRG
jgi:hypothetical protein